MPRERGRAETSHSTSVIRGFYTSTPRCRGRREREEGCQGLLNVSVGGRGKVQAGGMLTLAVIAVSTVLTAIAVVPVIPLPVVAVTTSAMSASSSSDFEIAGSVESRRLTGGPEIANGRECHGGRDHRSGHGRDGHPCGESSRECAGGWESGGEESAEGDGRGHGQNRSARTQKEECGPTAEALARGS